MATDKICLIIIFAGVLSPSLRVTSAQAKRPVAAARVVCSAERQEVGKLATVAATAAMAVAFSFGTVDAAFADVAGLTPCSESKAFAKRQKNRGQGLEQAP